METGGPTGIGRPARLLRRVWRALHAPRPGGYTITEVLIVLVVTTALFVGTVVVIAGRQNRTAFEQAVRNIQSQIQSAIDEVVIGHYPNRGNFRCVAGAGGPQLSAGAADQGTNGGCIFVGKVIQFKVRDTDPEQFKMYTMAGLRLDPATGSEAATRSQTRPILVAPTPANPGLPADAIITEVLNSGLTTLPNSLVYGAASSPAGGIAIWQSLATISGGVLTSSAQAAHIGAIPGTTLGMTQEDFIRDANLNLTSGPLDDPDGVRICFVSGASNQSGLLSLGGNNRRLTVTLDIKNSRDCT
jgi:type II secretory pathway pseudopilin PulG